jgi:hypothetical protein
MKRNWWKFKLWMSWRRSQSQASGLDPKEATFGDTKQSPLRIESLLFSLGSVVLLMLVVTNDYKHTRPHEPTNNKCSSVGWWVILQEPVSTEIRTAGGLICVDLAETLHTAQWRRRLPCSRWLAHSRVCIQPSSIQLFITVRIVLTALSVAQTSQRWVVGVISE